MKRDPGKSRLQGRRERNGRMKPILKAANSGPKPKIKSWENLGHLRKVQRKEKRQK